MSRLHHDLSSAWRQLRARPGLAAAAITTLALAIGANAAVFSLVNGLLFAPLPVARSAELVAVYSRAEGDFLTSSPLSTSDFQRLAQETKALSSLFAYTYTPLAVEHCEESRLVLGVRATPGYFTSLGITPALGRFFDETSATENGLDEVVLSFRAWRRHFGGDPGVIGRSIRVQGRPMTVVGVAPRGFFGLTRGAAPEIWLPLELPLLRGAPDERDNRWLWAMGRLSPGADLATTRAEIAELATEPIELYAVPAEEVAILPGLDTRLSQASSLLLVLVGLVLAIAAGNLAHLFLGRAFDRRRELATRRALGASRADLLRQLLVESLLLAALGGLGGLVVAAVSNEALAHLKLPLPVDLALPLSIDGRVVIYTLAIALASALLFGLLPATTLSRASLVPGLAAASPSRRERRLGGGLVVAELALALLLLAGLGLAARSLAKAQRTDPGLVTQGVVVATFTRPGTAPSAAFDDSLLARVRALPGVEAAGLLSHLPLTLETRFDRVAAAASSEPLERWPLVDSALAGPGTLETLGLRRLAGRTFEARDRAESSPVVVVNESLARRFFPQDNAVGQHLRVDGEAQPLEVVGLVADGKYRSLGENPRPFLYRVLAQARGHDRPESGEITTGSTTLVVRSQAPASAFLPELRRVLREEDSRIAIARLGTLEETLAGALFLPRATASLLGLFALLGMVLALFGLASLMLASVRRERRELGIRLALGASPARLELEVVGRALRLAGIGTLLGVAAALAGSRALSTFLHGVSPWDPVTFLAAPALLLTLALATAWLPARLAARTEAAVVLRGE